MKYLLDTNICIYLKRNDLKIQRKVEEVSSKNCFISEITVAELKFGAEYSDIRKENMRRVELLIAKFDILPISDSIDIYAHDLASLKRIGKSVEKFDALIAATAIVHNLTLVSNDFVFNRFKNLKLENWAAHRILKRKSPTPLSPPYISPIP